MSFWMGAFVVILLGLTGFAAWKWYEMRGTNPRRRNGRYLRASLRVLRYSGCSPPCILAARCWRR